MTLTLPQRKALHQKWLENSQEMTYRAFRRTVHPLLGYDDGSVMVEWCGMLLGIETDGYTHS